MEHVQKKAKITGHFRVALKPHNINVQPSFKKLKRHHDHDKENHIEVITIDDDDDDNDLKTQQSQQSTHPLSLAQQQQLAPPGGSSLTQQLEKDGYSHLGDLDIITDEDDASISTQSSQNINFDDVETEEESELDLGQEEKQQQQSQQKLNFFLPELSTQGTRGSSQVSSKSSLSTRTHYKSPVNRYIAPIGMRPSIIDHDHLMAHDIHCEPHYAWDSFEYDKQQELKFRTRKYLDDKQHNHQITPHIRARLVDWLVEMQDIFKLYHESLYMAVKIADQYLMKKACPKEELQLLYLASIFIAAKFDERLPPVEISELIEQSGNIYTRKQIISFEIGILSTLNFNIRFPLSYGFLRRFARCTRSSQKALTLARFILESSLLDYDMIEVLESKLAAAALLLAYEMLHLDETWSETAEFYTGFKQEELLPLLTQLNDMISRPPNRRTLAIKRKYSHEVFLSVARIHPLAKC